MSKKRKSDIIGIICGIIVLLALVMDIISANAVKSVGDGKIPKGALTLTGSAAGRNGPVEVEVVADAQRIYRIKVLKHEETEGIGDVAGGDVCDGE